ncbi:MAG TPA: MaoC family dehydratase [Acidimicrobiia bacterium]|nr:MaoC family dehydratase [Acidimicrobiia bacterium]
MSVVVGSIDDVHALIGQDLGTSGWFELAQEDIDAFADLTGDDQWIHTDPERAATGPFGTTIAHGYLTLSLLLPLLEEVLIVENRTSSINYGLDRVRFPAPVPSGSRIRMSATLAEATDIESGVQVKIDCVFEVDGQERPACVARAVLRHHFAA